MTKNQKRRQRKKELKKETPLLKKEVVEKVSEMGRLAFMFVGGEEGASGRRGKEGRGSS